MAHYALINDDNIVVNVIVAEQDFIDSGAVGDPSKWIQTSYNTYGGQHRLGGVPLRKNFAGVGMYYDSVRDAFYFPQPSPRFTFDEETCLWSYPPKPNDGKEYVYNYVLDDWEDLELVLQNKNNIN